MLSRAVEEEYTKFTLLKTPATCESFLDTLGVDAYRYRTAFDAPMSIPPIYEIDFMFYFAKSEAMEAALLVDDIDNLLKVNEKLEGSKGFSLLERARKTMFNTADSPFDFHKGSIVFVYMFTSGDAQSADSYTFNGVFTAVPADLCYIQ